MNLSRIEKLARQALNGVNIIETSRAMSRSGLITREECRSINSPIWTRRTGVTAGVAALDARPMGIWF